VSIGYKDTSTEMPASPPEIRDMKNGVSLSLFDIVYCESARVICFTNISYTSWCGSNEM